MAGGASAAAASDRGLHPAGLLVGRASRSADDRLALTASAEDLGKRVKKDAAMGKATLPALLGPEEARRRAEGDCDEALAALAPLGPRAEPLMALARLAVTRRK